MNSIHVLLTTTSPWHVAYPGNQSKKKELEGISLTQSKTVGRDVVPCYLGNGLRGAFRRAIASRIIARIKTIDGKIPTAVYTGLNTGSASARPDTSPNSVEELVRTAPHIYTGLFGGGARTMASRYTVSDINPILHSTVETGEIVAPEGVLDDILDKQNFEKDNEVNVVRGYQLLETRWFTKVDDIARGHISEAIDVVEGGAQGVADYINGNSESTKKRKADTTGDVKKEDVGNLLGIQTIKTGTQMHFRVDLHPDVTEAQYGAILLAMSDVFNKNYIGGWGRIRFGTYRVSDVLIRCDAEGVDEAFSDLYQNETFSLEGRSAMIDRFMGEAKNEIENIDMKEIVDFFTNVSTKKAS